MKSIDSISVECLSILNKNRLLKTLIQKELVQDKLSKVTLGDDIKAEIMKKFYEDLAKSINIPVEEWVLNSKLTKTELENIALKSIRLKQYCKDNYYNKVESRFLSRKNELDIVVYSLIRVNDFFKARELFFRISEKEIDIGDLASEYSEGIEKKTRGIIGPCPIGKAHPQLRAILQRSKPGEVHPPVKIQNSVLIVRVEFYEPAILDDFMREKMGEEMFNESIESEASKINLELLKKINIEPL